MVRLGEYNSYSFRVSSETNGLAYNSQRMFYKTGLTSFHPTSHENKQTFRVCIIKFFYSGNEYLVLQDVTTINIDSSFKFPCKAGAYHLSGVL